MHCTAVLQCSVQAVYAESPLYTARYTLASLVMRGVYCCCTVLCWLYVMTSVCKWEPVPVSVRVQLGASCLSRCTFLPSLFLFDIRHLSKHRQQHRRSALSTSFCSALLSLHCTR